MDLSFANPAGFWALLGLPAIIAIHFLQRQSKILTISTLFLIDQLTRESVRGRKLERIRHSVPLWLQLLMVLLLTWILIQPRWIRPESVQRIALVLDSSASMSVFKDDLAEALGIELAKLRDKVSRTEYVVLDSAISDLSLYNGDNLTDLLASIEAWQPLSGAHDFAESLQVGRSLVGGEGLVVLATDHQLDTLPFNARLLAIGSPRANIGFAGFSVVELDDGRPAWRAVVRNYSDEAQTRNWFLAAGNQRSPERPLTLGAGQSRTLEGAFPAGTSQVILSLEADEFPLDDQLPAVLPAPKRLTVARLTPPEFEETIDQVVASLGDVDLFDPDANPDASPDFFLYAYDPLTPSLIEGNALVLLKEVTLPNRYLTGRVAAENHPLMTGLNWQGLIARRSPGITPAESDTVLLWQDERALIFLRTEAGSRQLYLNFELATSNASRLPAFIVLMHRFVENLRQQKIAPMSANFETGQALDLAVQRTRYVDGKISEEGEAPPLRYRYTPLPGSTAAPVDEVVPLNQASLLRAPREPGLFTVAQGEQILLTAAAAFADTREADVRNAATYNEMSLADATMIEQHSESDTHWQIWLLLILIALLVCWHFVEKKRPATGHQSQESPETVPTGAATTQ